MILQVGRFGMRLAREGGGLRLEFRSSVDEPDRWLVEYAGGHPTGSGQTMTERTSMQVTAVYCAVDWISRSVSRAKLCLYEKTSPDERSEPTAHPVYKLLRYPPNPEMTKRRFWETFVGHLLLWGNGYAEIERDGGGRPVALWPLRPDRTFPRRLRTNGPPSSWPLVYAARSSSGPEVILQPEDVLHVMGYSYDGLRGLSPIALHRETLGLSMATMDYGARFFGNDARPGGVLQTPKALKPEAAARLKNSWEEAHRGGSQSHRTAVLENGVEWKAMGMPNEDAQYLQTRVFQLSEVARMYHFPLHMLAELSHATFSNIEHQRIEVVEDASVPWADAIEEEIERKLLLPAEQDRFYAEHNFSAQKRGDQKTQNESDQIEWMNGWTNTDELRAARNRNPLPNGQGKHYFVPANEQTLDRAINPPDPGSIIGPDGKPVKALPPKPGTEGTGAKAKPTKRDIAEQRALIARSYAALLEHVGERLTKKETAALLRLKPPDLIHQASEFLREHAQYVGAALQPLLQRLEESVYLISFREIDSSAAGPQPIGERDAFLREYQQGAEYRYVQSLTTEIRSATSLDAALDRWKSNSTERARDEAMRAVNAFALRFYKSAGAAEVEWVSPSGARCAICLNLEGKRIKTGEAFTSLARDLQHPPAHPGCDCQIVAA